MLMRLFLFCFGAFVLFQQVFNSLFQKIILTLIEINRQKLELFNEVILYDEVFHFLDEAIGKIEVDVMGRGSVVYRTGRVLSARITRLEDKENEVAV